MSFKVKKDARPAIPAMATGVGEHCKEGLYVDNVERLELRNVTFEGVEGEQVIKKNVGEIVV